MSKMYRNKAVEKRGWIHVEDKKPPYGRVWVRYNKGGVINTFQAGVPTNSGWRYDAWAGFPLFEDASYWRPLSAGVPADDCKGMER